MRICRNSILKTLVIIAFCMAFLGFSTVQSRAQAGPPPMFNVQPTNMTVLNGVTVTLTAKSVHGTSWVWLLNGATNTALNSIALNVPNILNGVTTSTLEIVAAGPANLGNYQLKVADLAGTVYSSNAAVNVGINTLISNVVNFVASGTGKLANGAFKLTLAVPTGSNIVVEATSDLVGWTPISTNTATSSSMTFTDAAAATISCRFYRAKIQ
jgi:hypothetical protein